MNGKLFLAGSASATAACWYSILDGTFHAVGGWPQSARRGASGRLDTVRSGDLLRTYAMTLVVAVQPSAPEDGSLGTLRALYESEDAVWFQSPVKAGVAEPSEAYLLGDLTEEALGPLWSGAGAYFLVPLQVSIA